MSEIATPDSSLDSTGARTIDIVNRTLARRYRSERRFQLFGRTAITASLLFLAVLLVSIFSNGYQALRQTRMLLDIEYSTEFLDPNNLPNADYPKLVRNALYRLFPEVEERSARRELSALLSSGAPYQIQQALVDNLDLLGKTVPTWISTDDDVDMLIKGHFDRNLPEDQRRLNDRQLAWLDRLTEQGRVAQKFNTAFFRTGDSREPEQAGIWGAVRGSFFTLLVTLVLSFPIGVAAAVYLEEFAPKNRWTDLIEVNINNLAAVPSIVFGLLGLAVFLNFFSLPRSAPLVGGLVLTLMTFPTIIIAGRAALKAVPPSIREAALGVGASKMQTVVHHVVPLALPGMLTGTIIGMARALGETAPLLMIGMVAFIVDIPQGFTDPATTLPVQIYLWADSPERAFVEKTSAAIMVLLLFMIAMNATAIFLRKRYERRW
jgi:phosphate transport system permease protein